MADRIPETERWLHEPKMRAELDEAVAWARRTTPAETDLDELQEKLEARRRCQVQS